MIPVWIIGSGGHAAVVIDTLRASGQFLLAGLLDDDEEREEAVVLGIPVRGTASIESIRQLGVEHAILAIGSNLSRAAVACRLQGHVTWAVAIHPQAYVAPGARVGEGSVVVAGAIVQPGASIGRHTIVNTGSSVDHDSMVSDYVHLAPGVRLAGHVQIAEGAFLGIGSVVLPKLTIGAWSVVGAGAVVTEDVPFGVTARGVPARHYEGTKNSRAGRGTP